MVVISIERADTKQRVIRTVDMEQGTTEDGTKTEPIVHISERVDTDDADRQRRNGDRCPDI